MADGDGLVVGLALGAELGDGAGVAVIGPAVTFVKVNGWFGRPPPACAAYSPSSPAAATCLTMSSPLMTRPHRL